MKARRMEKNVWQVTKYVADMNGGAPVLNERIKGYLLEDKQE